MKKIYFKQSEWAQDEQTQDDVCDLYSTAEFAARITVPDSWIENKSLRSKKVAEAKLELLEYIDSQLSQVEGQLKWPQK